MSGHSWGLCESGKNSDGQIVYKSKLLTSAMQNRFALTSRCWENGKRVSVTHAHPWIWTDMSLPLERIISAEGDAVTLWSWQRASWNRVQNGHLSVCGTWRKAYRSKVWTTMTDDDNDALGDDVLSINQIVYFWSGPSNKITSGSSGGGE